MQSGPDSKRVNPKEAVVFANQKSLRHISAEQATSAATSNGRGAIRSRTPQGTTYSLRVELSCSALFHAVWGEGGRGGGPEHREGIGCGSVSARWRRQAVHSVPYSMLLRLTPGIRACLYQPRPVWTFGGQGCSVLYGKEQSTIRWSGWKARSHQKSFFLAPLCRYSMCAQESEPLQRF